MAGLIISVMYCVLCLWYQVFDGISMCIICNNDGECDILHLNMLLSAKQLQYSGLWFTDHSYDLMSATLYSYKQLFITVEISNNLPPPTKK
jgi:hypothetical protein